MVTALPEIPLKIIEITKQHRRVIVSEASNVTGISRNTIKAHLKVMLKQGYLTLNGAGRGAWYSIK
ncbi:MAG: winged helix-turn-helix transcriptional regulator [Thiohalomonadales bacterium]